MGPRKDDRVLVPPQQTSDMVLVLTPEVQQAIRDIVLQELVESPPMRAFRDKVLPRIPRFSEMSDKLDILENAVKTLMLSPQADAGVLSASSSRVPLPSKEIRNLQDSMKSVEDRMKQFEAKNAELVRSLEDMRRRVDQVSKGASSGQIKSVTLENFSDGSVQVLKTTADGQIKSLMQPPRNGAVKDSDVHQLQMQRKADSSSRNSMSLGPLPASGGDVGPLPYQTPRPEGGLGGDGLDRSVKPAE